MGGATSRSNGVFLISIGVIIPDHEGKLMGALAKQAACDIIALAVELLYIEAGQGGIDICVIICNLYFSEFWQYVPYVYLYVSFLNNHMV